MKCEGVDFESVPSTHGVEEPLLDLKDVTGPLLNLDVEEPLLDLKYDGELISDLKVEEEELQKYPCDNNSSMNKDEPK